MARRQRSALFAIAAMPARAVATAAPALPTGQLTDLRGDRYNFEGHGWMTNATEICHLNYIIERSPEWLSSHLLLHHVLYVRSTWLYANMPKTREEGPHA